MSGGIRPLPPHAFMVCAWTILHLCNVLVRAVYGHGSLELVKNTKRRQE